ncbi:HAMP domain-containing protein [Cohnella sp. CFH 77786]|uniref:sensor histidine kinase n=1 Tax=Cohnella sp. CFH 77786 TaxID=2662265 RepID=UPI001C608CAB|nr:HAMP domain-containing sensor histidine kinase [Cohnella sp. CFH 77786]MBW5446908.1 HAMP domain-containing protein [Cohnella sp. CFH 77786]
MSIRLRLTLWYSGLLAVALVAFGVVIYTVVYRNTMNDLKKQLTQLALSTDVSLTQFGFRSRAPRGYDPNSIYIQLISYVDDKKGTVTQKTENMAQNDRRDELTFPHPDIIDADQDFSRTVINGMPFLVYQTPLFLDSGRLVGLLQVGAYTGKEEHLFSQLRTILWIAGVMGLAAAFALGMFLSRKALRPINRVTEAAERIQSGSELGHRIPREKPNDEIGRLTDTLNSMLARIEKAYNHLEETNAAQRRFVSDASHELRTPLTTIRGNIDLLHKIWTADEGAEERMALSPAERKEMSLEAVRDIADEARRMSSLVGDLLSLARADAGYEMEMEPIPLRQLVDEAARRASFLPRQAEWNIGPLDALEDAWVKGSRDYLLQLLFILIENGFKYTPDGEVRLFAVRDGERIGLVVGDTGIGIPAEDLPHIFDRFYRADPSRGQTSGTGLGLSIAKWIADMHKGTLDVKSTPGVGSAFTLWLPLQEKPVSE